ncbi:MAG: hypothetical protein LBP50_01300 [Tannerella sp.]|jgi:hypothetical protein|nr:hypothetical protein [Tannerella sp.]
MEWAETCRLMSETPLTDRSESVHGGFAARLPLRLSFEGHDRGKGICFAARRENTRGVKSRVIK